LTITVFNQKSTAHKTGDYPIFFGQEPSLYDSINQPYPYFYELMEKLKQLDWSENDVDLTQTRMDLLRCDINTRNLSLFNLAYQWSLDSIATSIPTLLAPFVTNSEYGHVIARIGENENLHSVTYSNIVRQCVPDPQEIFDMVFKHEQVLERSSVVSKALADLKEVGAKYTLGLITSEEAKPYVIKGLVAIYALERISFMSSFACTFALAEQEYFVGMARLVQKILIDEMIHFETQRYALSILKESKDFDYIFEDYKQELTDIVSGVVKQELSWNKYLFSSGRSLVGLNEGILNDWTRYCAQDVYDNLEFDQPFRKTVTCPLPWFETDWMDLNSQQNANMESDATNYMVSSVSREAENIDFSDLDIFDMGDGEVLVKYELSDLHNLTIYTKPDCPFCTKLKDFLGSKGVDYVQKDVVSNPEHKEYLLGKGLKTVPQVFDSEGNYHGDCTSFIAKYS
jgi:ribonucleoside-diphosphate reductase beta chain